MTQALYVVSALLLLVWLGLVLRSVFADRSRGRRRCPKCFYEIDRASGLKCSECGHEARNEQDLARTHRHWPRACLVTVLILMPALLTSGIARVQQSGGWRDLPDGFITRLLWIDSDGLHDNVISRIGQGELNRAQAQRVVLAACRLLESERAERRARGFAYLNQLARNSAWNVVSTPEVPRPMLEELRPDVSISILLEVATGDNAGEAQVAISLLKYLQDVDAEVVLTLLQLVNHSDPTISQRAINALIGAGREGEVIKRLPPIPYRFQRRYIRSPSTMQVVALKSFATEVQEHRTDRNALLAWAKAVAEGSDETTEEVRDEPERVVRRAMALWLLCRLDEHGASSWTAVTLAAQDDTPMISSIAISHVFGFAWSVAGQHFVVPCQTQTNQTSFGS